MNYTCLSPYQTCSSRPSKSNRCSHPSKKDRSHSESDEDLLNIIVESHHPGATGKETAIRAIAYGTAGAGGGTSATKFYAGGEYRGGSQDPEDTGGDRTNAVSSRRVLTHG